MNNHAPPVVYIDRNAFMVMILAAVETFKRECFGYLYGLKISENRKHYHVFFALPIQLAQNRKKSGVVQSQGSFDRLGNLMASSNALFPHIGDFHSHPSWGGNEYEPELSEGDIEDMKQREVPLSIIIGISHKKRNAYLWGRHKKGGLWGTVGKYNVHINACRLIKNDNGELVEQILRIKADAAVRALNRAPA